MIKPVTLVKNPIQRPDEPRHFMVLKPLEHRVTAKAATLVLADSASTIRVHEAGYDLYDPVVYFPRVDVRMELLQKSEKTTHCPLKGHTTYFDLILPDTVIPDAAWSYHEVFEFDPRLEQLRDCIAFDARYVAVLEHRVREVGHSVR